jgi:hypothetical protein
LPYGGSSFTGRCGGVEDSKRSREKNAINKHTNRNAPAYLNHFLIVLVSEDLPATACGAAALATATATACLATATTASLAVIFDEDALQRRDILGCVLVKSRELFLELFIRHGSPFERSDGVALFFGYADRLYLEGVLDVFLGQFRKRVTRFPNDELDTHLFKRAKISIAVYFPPGS